MKIKTPSEELVVKEGDIIDFIALQWFEEMWEFDNPSILLNPVLKLYTNATPKWYVIEHALEEIITTKESKIVGENIDWAKDFYDWNINSFKRIAYNLLRGKKDGIKKNFSVLHRKVKFIKDLEEPNFLNYQFVSCV